jgi:hypothetical protein
MAMDDRWGRLGSTRALEVTRSAGNGWHPHLHVLLYFGEQLPAEQVVELTEVIYAAYRRGLERRGFSVARTATRTSCRAGTSRRSRARSPARTPRRLAVVYS